MWTTILNDADKDGDEQLSSEEAIDAMEAYLGEEQIAEQYRGDFEADISRKCGWHNIDGIDGLNQVELFNCLEEHGEWIWEEMSFYRTLSVHWW
jgi:hypothetical protein